ncbi:unnamed protein product, partial [Ranitomeya imitator]
MVDSVPSSGLGERAFAPLTPTVWPCISWRSQFSVWDPALFLLQTCSIFAVPTAGKLQDICPPTHPLQRSLNKQLDLVRTLRVYLARTASFRKTDSLFVIPDGRRRGLPASKATIARWIRTAILDAYRVKNMSASYSSSIHPMVPVSPNEGSEKQILRALNEMWKCQNMLRSHVRELLDLHKLPTSEANSTAMFGKLMTIAKNLPDPGKAQDFVKKFNQVLGDDEKLRSQLELLISPTCSCKQADICVATFTLALRAAASARQRTQKRVQTHAKTLRFATRAAFFDENRTQENATCCIFMRPTLASKTTHVSENNAKNACREIARKLANPKQPTNPFLEMVKFLLERIAPVHIDSEAISALVKLMNKSIEGTVDDEEEGVSPDSAIRAGLELLKVLSFTHPTAFHSAETYESFLQCLRMDDDKVAEAAIQIFRNTGHKIETDLPQIR